MKGGEGRADRDYHYLHSFRGEGRVGWNSHHLHPEFLHQQTKGGLERGSSSSIFLKEITNMYVIVLAEGGKNTCREML